MKFGILSDAHSNIEGFNMAIHYLSSLNIDKIYYLGDSIGYIPSAEVVEKLFKMQDKVIFILGNHELRLLQSNEQDDSKFKVYNDKFFRANLSEEVLDFLSNLPTHQEIQFGNFKILFVHGGPKDYTNEYVYPDTDLNQYNLKHDFVFMGHTHYPFINENQKTTFVNVGSCGLPRDDGRYGSFATFNTD